MEEKTELQIRMTVESDYEELTDWWYWHRWSEPPSIELLDNLRFGIMVHDGNENICAGFIYFTNAINFGLMEYIVSTYKVRDKEIRTQAMSLLIDSLKNLAYSKDVKVIFSSLKNKSLINHYKKAGFVIGSDNSTEMVCLI